MTPLMDRLGADPLINSCSMACSFPVTITPCACCHPAVLCLQSYSVHLSGAIYGKQFVVYHGTFSFWRTSIFYFVCICCTWLCLLAHFSPSVRIDYLRVLWFVLFPDKLEDYKLPFGGFRLSKKKCIVTKLKTRLFFLVFFKCWQFGGTWFSPDKQVSCSLASYCSCWLAISCHQLCLMK